MRLAQIGRQPSRRTRVYSTNAQQTCLSHIEWSSGQPCTKTMVGPSFFPSKKVLNAGRVDVDFGGSAPVILPIVLLLRERLRLRPAWRKAPPTTSRLAVEARCNIDGVWASKAIPLSWFARSEMYLLIILVVVVRIKYSGERAGERERPRNQRTPVIRYSVFMIQRQR